MTPKILTVGAAYMDMIAGMPRFPAVGETVLCEEGGTSLLPDGRAGNCAVALSRLGARAVLCCRVGEDINGQRLHSAYRQAGVDTSAIVADTHTPTGLSLIMTDGVNPPRTVTYPGANANLTPANLTAAFESAPDALLLHLDAPEDTVLSAAAKASDRHIPIFMDPAPLPHSFPFGSLPELEVFAPNEAEVQRLTGILPSGSDSCLRAAIELTKLVKAKLYIIKLGDRGAFIFDGRRCEVVGTYVVHTVDTAGVGDAYISALTLEYMRTGGDFRQACRYAAAVCALTVSRPGILGAFPTDEEAQTFMAKNGNP